MSLFKTFLKESQFPPVVHGDIQSALRTGVDLDITTCVRAAQEVGFEVALTGRVSTDYERAGSYNISDNDVDTKYVYITVVSGTSTMGEQLITLLKSRGVPAYHVFYTSDQLCVCIDIDKKPLGANPFIQKFRKKPSTE